MPAQAEMIRRLQPKLAKFRVQHYYMQPVQDLTIDTSVSRTQYQYSFSSRMPMKCINGLEIVE